MTGQLILAEEALLLALDDEKGTQQGSYVTQVLAGAALAEFALEGRIVPEGQGKKLRFRLVDETPPAHPFLRMMLGAMTAKQGFARKPSSLVMSAANAKNAGRVLKDGLVEQGVLAREESKVLFIFRRTTYPLKDTGVEEALKARLRAAMFHGHEPSDHDRVLIALINHAGLLKRNFDKDQLKEHKARIKSLSDSSGAAADATKSAIEATEAALMAALVAGSVASTATTG